MILQYKDLGGSVKDVDVKSRKISGYLSTFDVKDKHDDIIVKGAFTKSLSERKDQIFFLNQHNWAQPFGKFETLYEDAKGLYFVSNPMPDTTYANDAVKLYEAGILNEHSIGFITVKDEWNEGEKTRYIKEIKLYEGSVVTVGANSQTPFTGFKRDLKEIQDHTNKILKAFRSGTFTDETFMLLEVALTQLQAEAVEYGKSLMEPSKDTPSIEPINIAIDNFLNRLN